MISFRVRSASVFLKKTEKLVIDNSPLILTSVGVAGVIATGALAFKGGLDAAATIRAKQIEIWSTTPVPEDGIVAPSDVKFSKVQMIAMTWRSYLPPCAAAGLTIAAIVTANQIGTRRAAALAAAFALSEKASEEYKDKVQELLGKNKSQKLTDDMAQDRVDKNPPPPDNQVIVVDAGQQLFQDAMSNQYFYSSMESVKHAVNRLNHLINNDGHASLTDFYGYLGVERTGFSDEVGWSSDQLFEPTFSATVTQDGRTAMVLGYRVMPVRDYLRFH